MKHYKQFEITAAPLNIDLISGLLWELDITGINEEDDKLIYTFDNCKLKKDEYCTLTIEDNESKETASYKVDDDGETLVLRDEYDGTAVEYSGTITELTSTKLLLDLNVLGFETKLEFEKL